MRGFGPHYVGHNAVTRQPRRFLWLHTSPTQTETAEGYAHTWGHAMTAFDDRDPSRRNPHQTEWEHHADSAEMWRYVSSKTRTKARTVLFAHNLAYHLRVSDAFAQLVAQGWRVDLCRLSGSTCWVRWRRDGATLIMGDSFDWLPVSLGVVAGLVPHKAPSLSSAPLTDPGGIDALARAVAGLRSAMVSVLDWHERADLGNWQVTAAGTAWAAYRHRFMTDKILVHGDPDAREAERRACWTGRCEAWRWGRVPGRSWEEWDMRRAYATIARECPVPVKLGALYGPVSGPRLDRLLSTGALLAEVDVTTDAPLVPTSLDGRIAWPVGTFTTTLWDPEIRLLRDQGATVVVRRAWHYRTALALSDWADWVLALCDGAGEAENPAIQLVAKGWSRSLIGRFGLRYPVWEPYGTSEESAISLTCGHNAQTGEKLRILQLGHDVMIEGDMVDGQDSVPSITGWIMSECRRRLWLSMRAVGLHNVAYVDTDSIVVRGVLDKSGRLAGSILAPLGYTLKKRHRTLTVLGPHQIISGGKLKASGVPSSAELTSGGKWRATIWQTLPTALSEGNLDAVTLRVRDYQLKGVDRRRVHSKGGLTQARSAASLETAS